MNAASDAPPPRPTDHIRVFLVEDDLDYAEGLRSVINDEPDMTCVGLGHDMGAADIQLVAAEPDVVVIDLHLPDGSGLDLCREVKAAHPEMAVLVLTADDDPATVVEAMEHDADAFALKLADLDTVLSTIRFVHEGNKIYDARHL